MAAEAHVLAHTMYWMSSKGYISATGRPVEINATGPPVEWFYWTSSRADDLGLCLINKLRNEGNLLNKM